MPLTERLLQSFCVPIGTPTPPAHKTIRTLDGALDLLKRVYPDLAQLVGGKRVLDFGCGAGLQSIALAKTFDCHVTGLDTNEDTLALARRNAQEHGVGDDQVAFASSLDVAQDHPFDVVIAKDSFEHFDDPRGALAAMAGAIHEHGIVLITFGPPWLAPYGSHMHFFCKLPWVNVFFSERTVMRVRAHYRDDGAERYQDVESGLNKMTIRRFESLIRECHLRTAQRRYDCVREANFLGKLPLLREFFINHVTVVLKPG